MSLYTQAEMDAGYAYARQKINDLAGWYASMIPDDDVRLIVSGVLNVAAKAREQNPNTLSGA